MRLAAVPSVLACLFLLAPHQFFCQTSCPSPTPKPAAPVAIPDEAPAIAALSKLTIDITVTPCVTTAPGACATIASDLGALVTEAAKASALLAACSYGLAAPAGGAMPANDAAWYKGRSDLWNQIATEQHSNAAAFLGGTYVLPLPLEHALTLPYNIAYTAPLPANQDQTIPLEQLDLSIRKSESNCHLIKETPCQGARDAYKNFLAAVINAGPGLHASSGQNWETDYNRILAQPGYFTDDKFSFSHLGVSHVRVMAGVDISAASSADPAAKFLGEADLDIPLEKISPIDSIAWLWGYARMASIQQPGAISGLANPTSYVSTLTAAAPNNIVQSFEATVGDEIRLIPRFGSYKRPFLVSWITDAGLITPVSVAQNGTPIVYDVTPALFNFYTSLVTNNKGNLLYNENSANITAACPNATSASIPTACYIAQYPEARSRFFRNYASGFRIKRYYYNDVNRAFVYPAIFDMTIGQNEFVSGGILRHLVAHVGGSTPIAGVPGLYAYAAFDLEVTKGNPASQQFVLNTAPSTITPSSANVASIFVQQPDSDRYRFGAAYDLGLLAKALYNAYVKNLKQ